MPRVRCFCFGGKTIPQNPACGVWFRAPATAFRISFQRALLTTSCLATDQRRSLLTTTAFQSSVLIGRTEKQFTDGLIGRVPSRFKRLPARLFTSKGRSGILTELLIPRIERDK